MIAIAITSEMIDKMKHAIGVNGSTVTLEYGKYRPYRNYYTVAPSGDVDWDKLVECGFAKAKKDDYMPGVIYKITRRGFDFLERSLGFKIEEVVRDE